MVSAVLLVQICGILSKLITLICQKTGGIRGQCTGGIDAAVTIRGRFQLSL